MPQRIAPIRFQSFFVWRRTPRSSSRPHRARLARTIASDTPPVTRDRGDKVTTIPQYPIGAMPLPAIEPTADPLETKRCEWAGDDPLMRDYHDREWGVPLHGDRELFELLTLEGAQAGLSWRTILTRREGYRAAFDGFEIERIATYDDDERERLRSDERIIRNRAKIAATVTNARATLALRAEGTSLDALLWEFAGGTPAPNAFTALGKLPTETERSRAMSKELHRHGFSFVGPTICYAFMQAAGMVNGHVTSCFRYAEIDNGT